MKTAEEEAQSLGWKPKDDWNGPEGGWKDAETFLKDGERMAGFVRKRLEKDFESRIAAIERTAQSALAVQQKQAEKERGELLAQLNAKKAEAIEENDLKTLEIVKEQIDEVKQSGAANVEAQKAEREFMERNSSWLGKDWVIQNFADGAAGKLRDKNLPMDEFFKEIEKQVRDAFPDHFGKKPKSRVEPDATTGGGDGAKTFADLPKEEQKICDGFVKQIKGFTREQYVRDYYNA